MKRKILSVIIALVLLLVLFFPFVNHVYKDGGTISYAALTYKIVKWRRYTAVDETREEFKKTEKTRVYFFPNNFKSIDELWELEKENSKDSLFALAGKSIITMPFEYFSDVEGIFMQPWGFNFECEKPYIEVKWHNLRDTEYCIGEYFDILYAEDEGDNAESCATEDLMFNDIGIIIPARNTITMKYEIDKFDFSNTEGIYSISSCAAHMENGDELMVGFKFRITDDAPPEPLKDADEIDDLVQKLANPDDSSVMLSSNPRDYIRYNIEHYNRLVNSGDYVLDHCVKKLENTDANGLEGYIMACICADISGIGSRFDIDAEWDTAQGWLELYKNKSEK